MPSLVVHLLLPPLALLATGAFRWRFALLLLPVSLLPDLDFFLGVHRASLHNVFVLVPFAYVAWRWRGDPSRETWREVSLIVFAYLASHQLMDAFVGGVVPLWPVLNTTLLVDVQILVNTRTLETDATFEPASHAGAPETSPIYEFLNGTEFAILMLVLAVALIVVVRRALIVREEVVIVSSKR